ncbi:MAG TPA: hypothetical protein VKF32_05530, partial [Thermoanaerobaculia bacterium]|nr:hypothetical protein [Thermoanaerobaculia bacterium]
MTVSSRIPRALLRAVWISALLAFPPLFAVAPRIVTVASARDFLAGDAKGTAITADGRLTLASPLSKKSWPEDAADAVVLAAASDSSGDVFVATGGGLGRLFVSSPDGAVSLLYTAPEANLTAVAVAPDGAVVCASSPNGSIYRLDRKEIERARAKKTGASAQEWGSPKESAIWALAFAKDGTLYVGTGNKGRIYRRSPSGSLALFKELDDVHVRTLTVAPDGKLWAGTSDAGLLVAISPDGSARTVHDFGKPEVIGIVALADGSVCAAATSAEPPPIGPPAGPEPKPSPPPAGGGREEVPKGTVTVTTSAPRLGPAAREPGKDKGAEIVVVSPDGFVEPGWAFTEETIYSMRLDPKREELIVATGPRGRVYSWKARHVRLEAQTEQQQVVAAPAVGDGFAAVTMAAPGVFRPDRGRASIGTYTSLAKDAGRLARFGRLRFEGEVPGGASASFAVRAGNAEKPDHTWTEWRPIAMDSAREGSAELPAARFFQWRAELKAAPSGAAPTLDRVEWSYSERNARPVVESVNVLEPGAVYAKSGASGSAVLSVTNPDENGIYAGLESPREGPGEGPGKRLYRKGYRTLTWKGVDPNGDQLRYDVEGRLVGDAAWFPVRKDVEEPYLSFDTTALPDGHYRFRVTASDHASNPEGQALTAAEESALVVVDNTPPVLKVEAKRVEGAEIVLVVRAIDALSPISKAE